MSLTGKGYYIWKIPSVEGGNPTAIRNVAVSAGLSHVLIKVADADRVYNYDTIRNLDLVPAVARELKNAGITVWGWQYIYGENPLAEARKAIQRVKELNLEGFVVNAEVEFKAAGMDVAARKYMTELRNGLRNIPLALSSFRFPSYHPQFPWDAFLEFCDVNMPQVYWQGAHNADAQLKRTVSEFESRRFKRPIIPTGAAYAYGDWKPTPNDVIAFLNTARSLKLSGANFWSWDYARLKLPDVWRAIKDYSWSTPTPPAPAPAPLEVPEQYIAALNAKDAVRLATIYTGTGVRVLPGKTLQGAEALLIYYYNFLNVDFPDGVFTLTGMSGSGNTRQFTWTAVSPSTGKQITNGNDTIGMQDGRILYHYSYFTVTESIPHSV
ncbi:MAG: nuclear transport factor 2 family protein [Anaerolineae bacterium]|nr:MAG: nuclear transport factor 2 family protein [Anaerolineae bacterium]